MHSTQVDRSQTAPSPLDTTGFCSRSDENLLFENVIDASFVITHRGSLEDAPELYATFESRRDGCVKVAMIPCFIDRSMTL